MQKRRMRRIGEPKEPYIFLSKLEGNYVTKKRYDYLQRRLTKHKRDKEVKSSRIQSLVNRFNKLRIELNENKLKYKKLLRLLNRTRQVHANTLSKRQEKVDELRKQVRSVLISRRRYQKNLVALSAKLREKYNIRLKVHISKLRKEIHGRWRERVKKYRLKIKHLQILNNRKFDRIKVLQRKLDNQKRYVRYERKQKRKFKSNTMQMRAKMNKALSDISVERRKYLKRIKLLEDKLRVKPRVVYKDKVVKVAERVEVIPKYFKDLEKKLGDVEKFTNETSKLIELNLRTDEFLAENGLSLIHITSMLFCNDKGSVTVDIAPRFSRYNLLHLVELGYLRRNGKKEYFLTISGENLVKKYLELMRKRSTFISKD